MAAGRGRCPTASSSTSTRGRPSVCERNQRRRRRGARSVSKRGLARPAGRVPARSAHLRSSGCRCPTAPARSTPASGCPSDRHGVPASARPGARRPATAIGAGNAERVEPVKIAAGRQHLPAYAAGHRPVRGPHETPVERMQQCRQLHDRSASWRSVSASSPAAWRASPSAHRHSRGCATACFRRVRHRPAPRPTARCRRVRRGRPRRLPAEQVDALRSADRRPGPRRAGRAESALCSTSIIGLASRLAICASDVIGSRQVQRRTRSSGGRLRLDQQQPCSRVIGAAHPADSARQRSRRRLSGPAGHGTNPPA